MFDSPIEMCPECKDWVLTDQTRKECAREHHCVVEHCPLDQCFSGFDFTRPKSEHTARVLARGRFR